MAKKENGIMQNNAVEIYEVPAKKESENDYLINRLLDVIKKKGKEDYNYVLEYIKNEIQESTRIIDFNYNIKCFLEDGAYALSRSVEDIVGFMKQNDEKSPSGKNPPVMLNVTFSSGEQIKVPFGQVNLPKYGKDAYIDMQYNHKEHLLLLNGRCEKRYIKKLDEIISKTTNYIKTDSIYKNKAIKIVNTESSPEFIDLSQINKTNLFLTPDAQFATTPIEARIEKTDVCIKNNIDIRFGAILAGSYGTGKTLYAFKLAYKAILNGWSFIYCPNSENILYVMEIASMLSENGRGTVIFAEDIDQVLSKRDNSTNEISLMMDGGESKNKNVITILTTNHIELIDPTFLRGKRIGSIVTLTFPDTKTAQAIIESVMVDENGQSILEDSCLEAAEMIEKLEIVPAFIMEILDRVKSHLLYEERNLVNCQDIINSINSYKEQMDIARLKKVGRSKEEQLSDALLNVLDIEGIRKDLEYISNNI